MRCNQVVLIGRLTRDPELKYSPNGTATCRLRLAYDQGAGENKTTGYCDVTCFQKTAEAVGAHKKKGDALLVSGRLEYREWEKDGQKRNAMGVVAHDVQFLSTGKKDDTKSAPDQADQQRPAGW